jgi:pyrimidine-nucleoside phosphorylase
MVENALTSGQAWEKFRVLVEAQDGDVRYVDHPERLPSAALVETVKAPQSGWLKAIHAREVGETAVALGAGRARKGDAVDHAVGIIIHCKVGDRVEAGEDLFTVHASDRERMEEAKTRLLAAHEWSDEKCDPLPLFYGLID